MSRYVFKMAEITLSEPHAYLSSRFPGLHIANVVFTNVTLGRGADATVYAVEWNGTVCAAKRLHEILLEDESPGGTDRLIRNFEAECLTWSKLRHPGVVQFLGVYLDRRTRLPVLVMEKMDTSLRTYLENHSKEEFPLRQKVFVLRQVTQALAYLHSQNPPLVHHDLSTNNVLLDEISFATKVSDFGMSRAINPSTLTRKSSVKGTLAFMAPEALQKPPKYDTKLDVFSFGNVVISTLTHEWPDPEVPTKNEGGQLVALSELQRRQHCTALLTAQEKQLFLPVVCQCLENIPEKRPFSVTLVRDLRLIESSIPEVDVVVQLRHQLSAKVKECKQKDEVIQEKDEVIREKDEVIREKDEVIREKDEVIREKDEVLREKNEVLREKDAALVIKDEVIQSKVDVIEGKDELLQCLHKVIYKNDEILAKMDEALRKKDEALWEKDVMLRKNEEEFRQKDAIVREMEAKLQSLRNERKKEVQSTPGLRKQLAALLKVSCIHCTCLCAVQSEQSNCPNMSTTTEHLLCSSTSAIVVMHVSHTALG